MAAAIQPLEAQFDLTGVQKELAMGSLNFLAAFGALLGGRIADKSGRKATIKTCAWLFVVGTLLMALALDYTMLLVSLCVLCQCPKC
jgi:MFS family permease